MSDFTDEEDLEYNSNDKVNLNKTEQKVECKETKTNPLVILKHLNFTPSLVDICEIQDLEEIQKDYPRLAKIFKNTDDLNHALKVISSIKPKQRFSTTTGIYIQLEPVTPVYWGDWIRINLQPPQWLLRKSNGDDRNTNLRAIKAIFVGAFLVIESALQEREHLCSNNEKSRPEMIHKLKNEQLITRMNQSVAKAIEGVQNLKQTYADDAHTCARIDTLTETINDKVILIKKSLEFFEKDDQYDL